MFFKKHKPDLLMTYVTGKGLVANPEFKVFLKSAHKHFRYHNEKVILYPEGDDPTLLEFTKEYGFSPEVGYGVSAKSNLLCARWFVWYKYLQCYGDRYRYVCLADARDVVFQGDFFGLVRRQYDFPKRGFIVVSQEGMTHRESEWNLIDQFKYQQGLGDWQRDFKRWSVHNAGVIIGTPARLMEWCLLMWQATMRPTGASDQAALNYLLHVVWPDGWYTSHPSGSPLILTCEGLKYKCGCDVTFEGGKIGRKGGGDYHIVHQWDRTQYRQAILDQYKD